MKTILILFLSLFLICSCKENAVQKPEKLIDQKVMVDIIYDLAVIEVIRTRGPGVSETNNHYIYKKYKIDSLQFAQNNRYYASDIKQYQKMYDQVNVRLETQKNVADSLAKKSRESQTVKKNTNDDSAGVIK